MAWIGAAIGLVGGLLSSDDQGSQTSTRTLDPRIAPYLYGGNGGGGLLNNVNNTMAQQYAQGGLNPLQNAGLEMQRQTLTDPRYTQGFDQMRNLGSGLLGQGVAGNPFTGSGMAMGTPSMSLGANRLDGGMQAGGAGGIPGRMNAQSFNPNPPQPMGNLGFNSTTAPAYQPIQQSVAAPQAPMQVGDLQALLTQAAQQAQQKTTQPVDDFRLSAGQ